MIEGENYAVDRAQLDSLLASLSSIKQQDGYLSPRFIDLNMIPDNLNDLEEMARKIRLGIKDIGQLQADINALFPLVQASIHVLHDKYTRLKRLHAITRLPDVVLGRIFQDAFFMPVERGFGCEAHPPYSFSHVCRRFRTVAVATPEIWTSIDNYQPIDQVECYLSRSKTARLYVSYIHIRGCTARTYLREFLKAVVPHAQRWNEFLFDPGYQISRGELESLTTIQEVSLSALTNLKLNFPPQDTTLYRSLAEYRWHAPNLTELEMKNGLVWLGLGDGLTRCELNLNIPDCEVIDFQLAINILRSSPQLEHLTIKFDIGLGDFAPKAVSNIVLPNLQTLNVSLRMRVYEGPIMKAPEFLCRLRTPQLKKLSLRVESSPDLSGQYPSAAPFFGSFVWDLCARPLLQEVEVYLDSGPLPITTFFEALSRQSYVRRLVIHCTRLGLESNTYMPSFPFLRYMELGYCVEVEDGFIGQLMERLREMGRTKFQLRVRLLDPNERLINYEALRRVLGYNLVIY